MNSLTACWCLLWLAFVGYGPVSANNRGPNRDQLRTMFQSNDMEQNLERYSYPTTPSPENVNCYVDVPSTVTVGGHCALFGGLWSCQSGVHVGLSDDCESQMRPRPQNRRGRRRRIRRNRNTPQSSSQG